MKNITYLSLLAVLIVLSSCKGNSFMSKRYTHFSRGHKTVKVSEGLVSTQRKMQAVSVAAEATVAADQLSADASSSPAAPRTMIGAQNKPLVRASHTFRALPVSATKRLAANPRDLNSQDLLVQHKANAASKHTFKAIIGELIGLVIWIIMVCVLVAAIILLVILL